MSNNIDKRLNLIKNTINSRTLARIGYEKFYDTTPIDTGNARKMTNLKGNKIEAVYSYAKILDQGRHMTSRGARGSYQAPRGMTEPTIEYIREYIRTKLGINTKGK